MIKKLPNLLPSLRSVAAVIVLAGLLAAATDNQAVAARCRYLAEPCNERLCNPNVGDACFAELLPGGGVLAALGAECPPDKEGNYDPLRQQCGRVWRWNDEDKDCNDYQPLDQCGGAGAISCRAIEA